MRGFKLFDKRERKYSTPMDKQDFLVRQIDEFKEKAKQLQKLLNDKESRVQELQKLVNQREEEAKSLEKEASKIEEIITEKQKASNDIMQDVKNQMTIMSNKMNEELGQNLQQNNDKLDRATQMVAEWNRDMKQMEKSIEEKIHSENVKSYRNMQMIVIEMNKKLVQQEDYHKDMVSLQTMIKCITWVGIINFVVLLVFILLQYGVFH